MPVALGAHAPADPVVNVTDDVGFSTIAAALAASSAGDLIVVRPGTYTETLTVSTDVTLCSTVAAGLACGGDANAVIVDGDASEHAVTITADGATVRGFTIQNAGYAVVDQDGAPVRPSLVRVVNADDVTIVSNILQDPASVLVAGESRQKTSAVSLEGGSLRTRVHANIVRDMVEAVGPDGTCANLPCRFAAVEIVSAGAPSIYLNNMVLPNGNPQSTTPQTVGVYGNAAGASVRENSIQSLAIGNLYGVKGTFSSSVFQDNLLSGALHGLFLSGTGLTVTGNDLVRSNEGLRITASASTISGNDLQGNNVGVQLAGPNGGPDATGLVFRENTFGQNKANLVMHAQLTGVAVDARENDWGVYTADLIRAFITDADADNTVDISCYIDLDGAARVCPPAAAFTFGPSAPAWNQNVVFTDASASGGNDIVAWAWDFAGLGTSDAESAVFRFATGGSYVVGLTVTDSEGFSASTSRTVVVSGAPVLTRIGPKTIDLVRQSELRFTVSAQAGDANPLTYSASNLPSGATFDGATRTFSWTPTTAQVGSYAGVRFTVSNGAESDFEDVTLRVVRNAAPNVAVSIVGPATLETTPGEASEFTFRVKNLGLAENTFDLAVGLPDGWTSTPSATQVTLAKGAETLVTVSVVPDASRTSGAVSLVVGSADGANGVASATLRLPVALDVAMDFATFFLGTDVTGTVSAAFLDGTPAVGVPVQLTEQSSAAGQRAPLTRSMTVLTGAGATAFAFAADPTGSTAVGEHTVTASAAGASDTATYTVL